MSQPSLAQSFIDLLRIQDAVSAKTPYLYGISLHSKTETEETLDTQRYPYNRAIGILRYLVDSTRPDLAFIVGVLVRHVKKLTTRQWAELKQIARYIKGSLTHGLFYEKSTEQLNEQSDGDFVGCKETRQSTYVGLIYNGKCLISWCSRRIKSVATSSFEAEYIAASNVSHHIRWLRTLLSELFTKIQTPSTICSDNQGAIAAMKAQATAKKYKYIQIRYHHVQNLVTQKIIRPQHLSTQLLQADALTQAVRSAKVLTTSR